MRILFTDADRDRARRVGRVRHEFHNERNTLDSYGLVADQKKRLRIDLLGAIAELAVAKALGVEDLWVEFTEKYKDLAGDVGNVQVRSTEHPNGRLIVHPQDPGGAPFVLVRLHGLPEAADVVGWAFGVDCQDERFWRADLPRPCFMVPGHLLNPDLSDWCASSV